MKARELDRQGIRVVTFKADTVPQLLRDMADYLDSVAEESPSVLGINLELDDEAQETALLTWEQG